MGILKTQRHSHAEPRLLLPLCLSSVSYGGFRSWETVKPLLFHEPLSSVALGESPSSVCEDTEGADEAHREGRSCVDERDALASRPGKPGERVPLLSQQERLAVVPGKLIAG